MRYGSVLQYFDVIKSRLFFSLCFVSFPCAVLSPPPNWPWQFAALPKPGSAKGSLLFIGSFSLPPSGKSLLREWVFTLQYKCCHVNMLSGRYDKRQDGSKQLLKYNNLLKHL